MPLFLAALASFIVISGIVLSPLIVAYAINRFRLAKSRQNRADEIADGDACWSGFEIEQPSPIARRGRIGSTPSALRGEHLHEGRIAEEGQRDHV